MLTIKQQAELIGKFTIQTGSNVTHYIFRCDDVLVQSDNKLVKDSSVSFSKALTIYKEPREVSGVLINRAANVRLLLTGYPQLS